MSKEELEKYFFDEIEKYGDFRDMGDFEESTNGGAYIRLALQTAIVAAYNKGIEDAVKAICSEKPLVVNVEKKLNSLRID